MISLSDAVQKVVEVQKKSSKPLAIILAGHNGSGKSTMWYDHLAPQLQVPLVNADRMMVSILPEASHKKPMPDWAARIRDQDESWMLVAQKGVQAFVAQALLNKVPFAMETVFSHWEARPDGSYASKIDQIREMQKAGYFVLLVFVGLANPGLSVLRVSTRVAGGGHAVAHDKLVTRFPRTQKAVEQAVSVADASVLTDNSRDLKHAFTVCRVQLRDEELFDWRALKAAPPAVVLSWLNIVAPR